MALGISRRSFLAASAAASAQAQSGRILDIHQHSPYSGRTDAEMIAHQDRMGITRSILLPAGSRYGLAAGAGGNDICLRLVREHPSKFLMFANEAPELPEAGRTIERYLKLGAIGIGEQKFPIDCDSPAVHRVAQIARHWNVPVLLHFEHNTYNIGFQRFYRILDRYPTVNFIGHAQTWWGNIDKDHQQEVMYPKLKVTPGGWTDRYLSDYPNIYGDLSAGSGLNALGRDEDHARAFLDRHQDRLLYGSDCNDRDGQGERCSGSKQIAQLRRLAPNRAALEKIFWNNSQRLFRL